MTNCPVCGKEQRGASAFCASCGALLDRPDTDAAPPPQVLDAGQASQTAAAADRISSTIKSSAPRPVVVDDFGDIGLYIARRLFALLVDLIGIPILLATGIGYLIIANRGSDPHSYATFFEVGVYTLFALIVYRCLSEAYLGTTLGKALVGLRVRAVDAQRVGLARGLTRNVFLPFDLCVIGFVLAVITKRRRRIGDFVAGTEVVNAHRAALGTLIAIAILGAWGYGEYAYGDGLNTAQTLSNTAQTYGPALLGTQNTPPPTPAPLPERTPVPTEQPITVPTLAPSPAPSFSRGTPAPSPAGSSSPASAPPSRQGSSSPATPAPSNTTS